jgi:hypothetical protein
VYENIVKNILNTIKSLKHLKVDAVVQARKPESASEVRSFLGLVNFVARFIPDLATKPEPFLHRLLQKDTKLDGDRNKKNRSIS